VKLFCPSCYDIYTPPNSRFQSVDGAFFGTTFGCLFFMTFPTELDIGGSRTESIVSPLSTVPGNTSQSRSSSLNSAPLALAGPEPPPNQPTQINGMMTSNFAPGLGQSKIYEPRIYGFRVSERARSGPRMQWLRIKPLDINELDEVSHWHAVHGYAEEEEEEDDGDTEMGSIVSTSQKPAIDRRKKAPMRKRRQITAPSDPDRTNTNAGEGG